MNFETHVDDGTHLCISIKAHFECDNFLCLYLANVRLCLGIGCISRITILHQFGFHVRIRRDLMMPLHTNRHHVLATTYKVPHIQLYWQVVNDVSRISGYTRLVISERFYSITQTCGIVRSQKFNRLSPWHCQFIFISLHFLYTFVLAFKSCNNTFNSLIFFFSPLFN